MGSLILNTAARFISPVLLLVSVVLFYRGHNNPGGGFIGGLIASIAFILSCLAHDVKTARRKLRADSRSWMAAGLVVALAAGMIGVAAGKPFLTGKWISFRLPLAGEIYLGTPTLFDLGIYLLVIGVIATIISNLSEE